MTLMENVGLPWKEETVTDLVLSWAGHRVAVYPFNKNEEGGTNGTGADWLWWWIDPDGTAFGMLVQAKRLKKGGTKTTPWDIDFTYKSGAQRSQLLATAKKLQVAAAYVLYFGSPNYTADIQPPGDDPHLGHSDPLLARDFCLECAKKTVAFLSADVARNYTRTDATQAYVLSTPIEDLACPPAKFKAPLVVPTVSVSAKLKAFIQHQQHGSKHVAQSFLAQTLDQRFGQFSLGTAMEVEASADNQVTEAPFFESLPDDRDHSGVQYFPEVLRGLRTAPPAYVLNLLSGEFFHLPDELGLSREEGSGIAGVVVVHDDGHEDVER
jgi:hypothetical protein